MKITEIRSLTDKEIAEKKGEIRKELFNLRLQQTIGQLEKPSRLNTLRKDVAKLETVLSERTKGIKIPAPKAPASKKEKKSA